MPEPFSFRLPISVPELDAVAGDWIEYSPRRPDRVYVIRAVPKAWALDVISRLRSLSRDLPADPYDHVEPRIRRLK